MPPITRLHIQIYLTPLSTAGTKLPPVSSLSSALTKNGVGGINTFTQAPLPAISRIAVRQLLPEVLVRSRERRFP